MPFSTRDDDNNAVHKREEGRPIINENGSRNNDSLGRTLVVYPAGGNGGVGVGGGSGGDRYSPTQDNTSISREKAGGGCRGRVGGGDRKIWGGVWTGNNKKKKNRVAPLSDADQRLADTKRGDSSSSSVAVGPDGVVGNARSGLKGDGSWGVTKLDAVSPIADDGVDCVRTTDGERGGGGARGGGDAVGRCGCTMM